MQQHGSKCFARRPPSRPMAWGQRVKIQLFQNMVMLHIKLKGTRLQSMVHHRKYPLFSFDLEVKVARNVAQYPLQKVNCYIQQSRQRCIYLRNEFIFWHVHGIMNTSGLLKSK